MDVNDALVEIRRADDGELWGFVRRAGAGYQALTMFHDVPAASPGAEPGPPS